MGNYVVKSSQLNSSFAYDNAQVIVNGSFSKDAGSGDLISVHGDVYTNNSGQQGTYIGNFKVPFLRSGFRMVVFSVVIMIIVLFFSKGIMGDKELTWEGIGGWLNKLKSKKKLTEKEG